MTAPLLNLPIVSPIPGSSTAPAAQGAAGGFEALLAGLFGEPGEQVASGLFADKPMSDEDAELHPGLADGPTTPPQSAQAQVLAAMLATAPAQNLQTTTDAATADTPDGEAAGAAPVSSPFPTPAPDVLAGAAQPAPPPSHRLAQTAMPQPDFASRAQPEMQAPVALAATDPQVAAPAADRAPEIDSSGETATATSASPSSGPAPAARPATTSATVTTPPTVTAPPAPAPVLAQAPSAPPMGAQPAAPQVMAQAETLATEAPAEALPVQPNAAPRNAKAAETARRGPVQATATPVAPSDEPALPTAVGPNTNASPSTSGGAAPSIETQAGAAPREAKVQAASDAPDFQPPAPAPVAHTTAPTPHAAPVVATSATVANLTAQISKKLEGQSTKFDVELNPAGLGRVNVSVEIAASGKMSAAMSFDTPQAAAELRARSHELQRALEQAGFDLSGGLSFDVAGDRGDSRGAPQQQQNDDAGWRGRAFQAVLAAGETVEAASSLALNYGRRSTTGVDVRI